MFSELVSYCILMWQYTQHNAEHNFFLFEQPRNSACFHPKYPQAEGLSHRTVVMEKSATASVSS